MKPENEIISEACAWVAQLESGDLSASDLAALREWLERSPAHKSEIHEIARLSGKLSELTQLAPALETSAGVGHLLRRSERKRRFLMPAVVTALAIVMFAGVIILSLIGTNTVGPELYKTAIGEYRTIELADGSYVHLNTDSQIEVQFNDEERRVRLINGEALFEVASRSKWPFIVYSETAIAEAIGTSFVVRLRDTVTELAVVEGVVSFSQLPLSITHSTPSQPGESSVEKPDNSRPREPTIVKAGQALTSDDLITTQTQIVEEDISILTGRDLQRKLSWTDGFLEFSETPLEEVIEEITRHNVISVEIADPALKDIKFGGIFRTGDVEQLLSALEGLGVEVQKLDDKTFKLSMADVIK